MRAKAPVKKAMLEVEPRKLENWQALKKEELALEMKKKKLELETEIVKSEGNTPESQRSPVAREF